MQFLTQAINDDRPTLDQQLLCKWLRNQNRVDTVHDLDRRSIIGIVMNRQKA